MSERISPSSTGANDNPIRVEHDLEGHRFVIFALPSDTAAERVSQAQSGVPSGGPVTDALVEAGFAEYAPGEGVRDFHHTVVDPAFRGRGLSGPLVQAALDDTRAAGLRAIATCSAVEHFISKHPEYADLL